MPGPLARLTRPRGLPLAAALFALGLAGCASFAYERLDWLALRWLNHYLRLDPAQKELARARLASRLDWHREAALPAYARWLEDLRAGVLAGMSEAEVVAHFERLEGFARELAGRSVDDAVALLATLRPVQVAHMNQRLAASNAEMAAEWVEPAPEALRERRLRTAEKQLGRWFGRLTEAQREALGRWSRESQPMGEARLAQRRRWQAELLAALEQGREAGALRTRLEVLLVRPETLASERYRAELAHNRAALARLLSGLSTSLTPAQRRHFAREVDRWRDTLQALARPAAPRYAEAGGGNCPGVLPC